MNNQTQIALDPQPVEMSLQERGCDPEPDRSLLADEVLVEEMRSPGESVPPPLFVP